MKKIIIVGLFLIFLALPFVNAIQQQVYILNLKYDAGKVMKEHLILTRGIFNEERTQPIEGYRLELVSQANEIIYTLRFNFPKLQKGPQPAESDIFEKSKYLPDMTKEDAYQTSFVELMIPYYENGEIIKIYNQNNIKVLEINLENYNKSSEITLKDEGSRWQKFIGWIKEIFSS